MTTQKYPQNLHTAKKSIFWNPPKYWNFEPPQKWPEPKYVWKYQSTWGFIVFASLMKLVWSAFENIQQT